MTFNNFDISSSVSCPITEYILSSTESPADVIDEIDPPLMGVDGYTISFPTNEVKTFELYIIAVNDEGS